MTKLSFNIQNQFILERFNDKEQMAVIQNIL